MERRGSIAARARGFTLIEVMVAVTLVAMLSTIIFVALRVQFRARDESYRVQRVYHQAEVSLNRMRRAFSMAFLSKHVDPESSRETQFVASGNKAVFTYMGHLRLEEGARESDQGVVELSLGNDQETGEKALFLREKAIIDDNPERGGRVVKLAERVRSLKFTFYDAKEEEWDSEWRAEMPDVSTPESGDRQVAALTKSVEKLSGAEEVEEFKLPDAVRIELVLEDEEDNEYAFATAIQIAMTRAFDW